MAPTYSVGELLIMRDTLPFVICNINKLNPKITSDVIKVAEGARIDLKRNARSSKDLSSMTRKSASRFSHTSGLSRDSERSHSDMKNDPWSPEDQEEVILFRGNLTLQSHEQRRMWMMRKRGCSDLSSQPFPAPSGFEAQKADNFRKFYAAVISPTHLRVTAGGRIVPNTRGLPHPTYIWNADKQFFESTACTSGPLLEQQKPWLPGKNLSAADPHSPLGTIRPAVEDFFGPPLHSNSSTRPTAPDQMNGVHSSSTAAPDVIEEAGTEDIVSPSESNTTALQDHIKISPPSQFDIFRPFFINGQPFYPASPTIQVPANLPILPFNMLGNLNASYQSLRPTYGMAQLAPLQLPAGNFGYPEPLTLDGQQMGQQIPLMHTSSFPPSLMAPQLQSPVGQPFGMAPMMSIPSLPDEPVTMRPQVVVMVKQIQALQQQLRYLENQLQNNKHQIDEQHVIHQQNHVQNQIRALQSGLSAQVFQSGVLPHEQYGSALWNTGVGAMGVLLAPITNSGVVAAKKDAPETSPVFLNNYDAHFQDKAMLKNIKAAIAKPILLEGDSQGSQSSVPPMLTSRKRLSAAAAMAPEFQPRSQLTIANQSGAMKTEFPMTTANRDPTVLRHSDPRKKAETEVPSNVTCWSTPGKWANSNFMHGPAAMPNGYTMHHLTKGTPFTHSPTHAHCQAPVSFNAVEGTSQNNSLNFNGVNPYLMGYPPAGMPANSVKPADMIYSRELTREELQARQLYWGKAPRVLSKGLPKFDGKDFYAPSPEKASVSPKGNRSHGKSHSSRRSNTSSTIPELNSPKSASSNVMLPSRRESKDSQDFCENPDSVERTICKTVVDSADSSPDNDTASLDAWGMAKADEEEIFDRPAYLTSSFNSRTSNIDDTDSVKLKSSVSGQANGRPTQPSFLQDMLKHTSLTTMAAPTGALSSTIAHGHLPRYGGFAVASLAPSISNVSLSSLAYKNARAGRSRRRSSSLVENQPLPHNLHRQNLVSAAEYLIKVEVNGKATVDHDFNPNTEGVGPVCGGSDW